MERSFAQCHLRGHPETAQALRVQAQHHLARLQQGQLVEGLHVELEVLLGRQQARPQLAQQRRREAQRLPQVVLVLRCSSVSGTTAGWLGCVLVALCWVRGPPDTVRRQAYLLGYCCLGRRCLTPCALKDATGFGSPNMHMECLRETWRSRSAASLRDWFEQSCGRRLKPRSNTAQPRRLQEVVSREA